MKHANRKPTSEETKAKISAANKGRYVGRQLSAETKRRMSEAKKIQWVKQKSDPDFMARRKAKLSSSLKGKYVGELSANWKGGINQNQRTDNRVFAWKDAVLKRDNYTCQVCDIMGVFLHIDHLKSFADYPELRFEVSNGRALCRPCHYYVTFKRKMPKGSKWGISKRQVGIKDLQ